MDPYVYPGTNVLRNLRDIRDPERLAVAEAIATTRRIAELPSDPKIGNFDTAHLRAIHRHIFQDLFDWAGEFRTVNIARSGQMPFAFPQHIVASVQKFSSDLAREGYLAKLSHEKFVKRAAHFMGELNAIHPFREGNGRTQREFIWQLAARSGYGLDWSQLTQAQVYAAAHLSFQRGDNSGLEEMLRRAMFDNVDREDR